jgi:hypothetical protein
MKYTVELGSDGMIYIPYLMRVGSNIQVLLGLLQQKFERLQYWYY